MEEQQQNQSQQTSEIINMLKNFEKNNSELQQVNLDFREKMRAQNEFIAKLEKELAETRNDNKILQNDLSRVENVEPSQLSFEMEGLVKKEDLNGIMSNFESLFLEMKTMQEKFKEIKDEQQNLNKSTCKINTFHWGTECGVCKVSPIEGKRYKCLIC